MIEKDVIVIGGGQSALACAYFLKREDLDLLLLDDQQECGGAWLRAWDSLTLFSPAANSNLPGWPMPASEGKFPSRAEVVSYLCNYEQRYTLPIKRPVNVLAVEKTGDRFRIGTDNETYLAKAVISATGSWRSPFIPPVDGIDLYTGVQLHSASYKDPERFSGKKVLVVGGGNSGAQLFSEISAVTETVWSTLKPPAFLPDDVDGSVLFNQATAQYNAQKQGKQYDPANYSLGNIVMVPSVLAARERGVLKSCGQFIRFYATGVIWADGTAEDFDAVVWCTGFKPATAPLHRLGIFDADHKTHTHGTKVTALPGIWLVGFGNWTGFASATLIGVGRSARDTAKEIKQYLSNPKNDQT